MSREASHSLAYDEQETSAFSFYLITLTQKLAKQISQLTVPL